MRLQLPALLLLAAATSPGAARGKTEAEQEAEEDGVALRTAAVRDDGVELKRLLDAGVPVDYEDTGGYTALLGAVQSGRLRSVHMLLEAGANQHHKAKDGLTPIEAAQREASLGEEGAGNLHGTQKAKAILRVLEDWGKEL